MLETNMHRTAENLVCQDSTLTTTSKPLSISSHVQMGVNQRISDVQKTADGHTHSFPSTPNVDSKKKNKDDLACCSTGRIEGLMEEQIGLLKEIHKQTKRSGGHQEKIVENTEKLVSLQEDHNETFQNFTGDLELLAVAEKGVVSSENDDTVHVTESSRPELSNADHVETDEQVHVMGKTSLYDVENVRSDQPCDSSGGTDEELDSGILERSPFAEESPPKPDTSNTQGNFMYMYEIINNFTIISINKNLP